MSCIIELKNPALMRFPHISCVYYDEYGYLRTWNICDAGKTLYRGRDFVVEFLLHFENKQQIRPNNVKIMYMYS